MSARRRLRLWRTAACVFALAFIGTVWPAGDARAELYEDGAGVILGWQFCTPGGSCADVEHPELYRTGIWWPCWAVDVPCSEDEG